MKRLKLCRWVAVLALAIALAPRAASAADADTLSISGTFHMDELDEYTGIVGADLAAVFARDNDHWWTLTLYGVTYSHDYFYCDYEDESGYGYDEEFVTSVHATSFDFEFFGPDADVLNEVVSQQLIRGDLLGDGFFTLNNVDYFDSTDPFISGPYSVWQVGLLPLDRDVGVSFDAGGGALSPRMRTATPSSSRNAFTLVEPRSSTVGPETGVRWRRSTTSWTSAHPNLPSRHH